MSRHGQREKSGGQQMETEHLKGAQLLSECQVEFLGPQREMIAITANIFFKEDLLYFGGT